MHKRNRLYVTIGLIYGLLGGLLMIVGWLVYMNWLVALGGALTVAAMALFGINMILTVRLRSPLDARPNTK